MRFDGETIVPDFLWRDRRLAIEADSERWHEHELTRERDADKQAILEANGWRVLRIDDQQVARRPQQTLDRVRAALAAADRLARGGRPAPGWGESDHGGSAYGSGALSVIKGMHVHGETRRVLLGVLREQATPPSAHEAQACSCAHDACTAPTKYESKAAFADLAPQGRFVEDAPPRDW